MTKPVTKITSAWLRRHSACLGAVHEFEAVFGKSAELNEENLDTAVKRLVPGYLRWLCEKLLITGKLREKYDAALARIYKRCEEHQVKTGKHNCQPAIKRLTRRMLKLYMEQP